MIKKEKIALYNYVLLMLFSGLQNPLKKHDGHGAKKEKLQKLI